MQCPDCEGTGIIGFGVFQPLDCETCDGEGVADNETSF